MASLMINAHVFVRNAKSANQIDLSRGDGVTVGKNVTNVTGALQRLITPIATMIHTITGQSGLNER